MNPRFKAVLEVASRRAKTEATARGAVEKFGHLTFSRAMMQRMLPKEVFNHLIQAIEGKGKISAESADLIASAMKDWAIGLGATHYCHWFQPLTGLSAEKQDAFIEWKGSDTLIEKFSGKQLIKGEPDGSSFPSGGLRSTHAARGYTSWDPSSTVFLRKSGSHCVLYIPSIFFSWTGKALDMKIPLLRSDAKINHAALRLMALCGIEASCVYSTLGTEQEYFLVDRLFYQLRPDLLLSGRTVYGASSPKGQELEDHYFGIIKERQLAFMQEFEAEAFTLGIPLKTRHKEVAPGQFEVAPIFERAAVAVDHNILLMELMEQVAARHDFACLFHEKPFVGLNGSGKHNNWSLATNTGMNLFDPTDSPATHLPFLILMTATLHAIYEHAPLLRASIGSLGNDHRLGGHEAPPVIISVYLGKALEELLDSIENESTPSAYVPEKCDLGLSMMPEFTKDNADRNRTSPFAFTGNKFEFRAVGSSANCALPAAVLNVIVAESLHRMCDEIEARGFKEGVWPVIRKYLKAARPIRFAGDNYSSAWEQEARERGLPIIKKSFHAFPVFKDPRTRKVFEGVLSEEELSARYDVMVERYSKQMNIEARLMVDMFRTQIFPAALKYLRKMGETIAVHKEIEQGSSSLLPLYKKLAEAVQSATDAVQLLESARHEALALEGEKRGALFCDAVGARMLRRGAGSMSSKPSWTTSSGPFLNTANSSFWVDHDRIFWRELRSGRLRPSKFSYSDARETPSFQNILLSGLYLPP